MTRLGAGQGMLTWRQSSACQEGSRGAWLRGAPLLPNDAAGCHIDCCARHDGIH